MECVDLQFGGLFVQFVQSSGKIQSQHWVDYVGVLGMQNEDVQKGEKESDQFLVLLEYCIGKGWGEWKRLLERASLRKKNSINHEKSLREVVLTDVRKG